MEFSIFRIVVLIFYIVLFKYLFIVLNLIWGCGWFYKLGWVKLFIKYWVFCYFVVYLKDFVF